MLVRYVRLSKLRNRSYNDLYNTQKIPPNEEALILTDNTVSKSTSIKQVTVQASQKTTELYQMESAHEQIWENIEIAQKK